MEDWQIVGAARAMPTLFERFPAAHRQVSSSSAASWRGSAPTSALLPGANGATTTPTARCARRSTTISNTWRSSMQQPVAPRSMPQIDSGIDQAALWMTHARRFAVMLRMAGALDDPPRRGAAARRDHPRDRGGRRPATSACPCPTATAATRSARWRARSACSRTRCGTTKNSTAPWSTTPTHADPAPGTDVGRDRALRCRCRGHACPSSAAFPIRCSSARPNSPAPPIDASAKTARAESGFERGLRQCARYRLGGRRACRRR